MGLVMDAVANSNQILIFYDCYELQLGYKVFDREFPLFCNGRTLNDSSAAIADR